MNMGVVPTSPRKAAAPPLDRIAQKCLAFLQEVLGNFHPRDFSFRLWDGSVLDAEPGEPSRFTMVLRNPGAFRTLFWSPSELALGEAYLHDDIDIEGNLESAFLLADQLLHFRLGLPERLCFARVLLTVPSSGLHRGTRPAERLRGPVHSMRRDRQAVTYHYDVSNAFYSLWLDKRMVYSCAYFTSPGRLGFPTAAGSMSVTIGKSTRRKATTNWSALGCLSMWESPGCGNIFRLLSACSGQVAPF
jgi:Mycolic acid cyclopropane synthetase